MSSKMSIEAPHKMNVIKEKLSYGVLSSNYFPGHENGNENNFREIDRLATLNNFQNGQVFTVPINVLPPPPHKIVKNIDHKDRSGDSKNKRKLMSAVVKGFTNDENAKTVHTTLSTKNYNFNKLHEKTQRGKNKNKTNGSKNGEFLETCNYYSPNVFQPNFYEQSNHINARTTRRYVNSAARVRPHSDTNNNHNRRYYAADSITRRVHGLMERFRSRSYLMKVDPKPPLLLTGSPSDGLSQAIWDIYTSQAQKESTYIRKLETWKLIFLSIKLGCSLNYGLYIVGSTMSGFGLETSDIDMCLLVKSQVEDPRTNMLQCLDRVRNIFIKEGIIERAELIEAKVPILKFRANGFHIDLNCNNSIGIPNTHLLHCYACLDWRVRALVIIVKVWAQMNNINDAKNMTISSYSLTLMVINYLQCGVTPPVLPCLHGLAPEIFNFEGHTNMDVQEDIEFIKDFKSDNKNSVGDLFIGFLYYYAHFNFTEFAISVRTGSRLPVDECKYLIAPKNDVSQWKYICVEEPFNFSNAARSVFDMDKYKLIKDVLTLSYWELSKNKILNTILPVTLSPMHQR